MGSEREVVRNLIDITGMVIVGKDKDVVLPRQKAVIDECFFEKAQDVAYATRGLSYERFAARAFGKGNPIWRAILDQEFHWQTLGKKEVDRLLADRGNPVERFANKYARDPRWIPKWAPRSGTIIDLNDFERSGKKVNELREMQDRGEANTLVSGNNFWTRRSLVHLLGEEVAVNLDPELGIILPPHYGIDSGRLKIGTAIRAIENGEKVKSHDDDTALALLLTIFGEVIMPCSKEEAFRQTHYEAIVKASGMINRIKESNMQFVEC